MGRPYSSVLRNRLLLAAIAGGLASVGTTGQAQEITGPTITVIAPRHTVIGGTVGNPIEMVSMSAVVGYGDLDLRTPAGKTALDKRVSETAQTVCHELDMKYPGGTPDASTCAKDARTGAQKQVDDAIAKAM